MILFEFLDGRGKGVITQWRDGLAVAQQAQFDEKLRSLEKEPELMPGLIAGPIKHMPNIYKLQVGGKVRLRPLLCRGPVNKNAELTFLVGATERDGLFHPPGVKALAEERLKKLIADPKLRKRYEIPSS